MSPRASWARKVGFCHLNAGFSMLLQGGVWFLESRASNQNQEMVPQACATHKLSLSLLEALARKSWITPCGQLTNVKSKSAHSKYCLDLPAVAMRSTLRTPPKLIQTYTETLEPRERTTLPVVVIGVAPELAMLTRNPDAGALPQGSSDSRLQIRSLVPKDWNSQHEVAWNWLWENVERLLRA